MESKMKAMILKDGVWVEETIETLEVDFERKDSDGTIVFKATKEESK